MWRLCSRNGHPASAATISMTEKILQPALAIVCQLSAIRNRGVKYQPSMLAAQCRNGAVQCKLKAGGSKCINAGYSSRRNPVKVLCLNEKMRNGYSVMTSMSISMVMSVINEIF